MNSTSNGTQILPGSNNSSTAGRAIDTYDRHYDGRQGKELTKESTTNTSISLGLANSPKKDTNRMAV